MRGVGVPPNHFYLCRAGVVYLVLMVVLVDLFNGSGRRGCGIQRKARRGTPNAMWGSGYGGVSLPVNTLANIGDSAIVHPVLQVMQYTDLDALGVATKGEHHGYT